MLLCHERLNHLPEAFQVCQDLLFLEPYQAESFPSIMYSFVKAGDFQKALAFVELTLIVDPKNILAQFFKVHILINAGFSLENSCELLSLVTRVTKKYSWHPDVALIKAVTQSRKKPLLRRCKDHSKCVLSTYYLNHFSDEEVEVKELFPQEKRHFETLVQIYKWGGLKDV